MTQGDLVTGTSIGVATTASVNFQPAIQNEWITVSYGSSQVSSGKPDLRAKLYDGTNEFTIQDIPNETKPHQKTGVTNTLYLRLTNNSASSANLCFTAVQTK